MPTPSGPSPSASTSRVEQDDVTALDQQLLSTLSEADADGEPDIPMAGFAPPPSAASSSKLKGRKSEPAKRVSAAPKEKPAPKLRGGVTKKATANSEAPLPPVSAGTSTTLSLPMPPPPLSAHSAVSARTTSSNMSVSAAGDDVEFFDIAFEEINEFEPPPPVTAKPVSKGLALPTAGPSSNTFVALAPPPVSAVSAPDPVADTVAEWGDEEDEEWENALGPLISTTEPKSAGIEGADAGEDDLSWLEKQMQQELGEGDEDGDVIEDDIFGDLDGDDDGDDDMEFVDAAQASGGTNTNRQPISLAQFAGGSNDQDDDDDTDSSSEDSDDDD